MARRSRVSDYFLPALVTLIVLYGLSKACDAEAGVKPPTDMEKQARAVLEGGGTEDPAPSGWPSAIADTPAPVPLPEVGGDDELGWGQWVFLGALLLTLLTLTSWLVVMIVRMVRNRKAVEVKKPPPPRCPVCDKPWEAEMIPLPRLVTPRRVFNLGRWQVVLPEEEEEQQGLKACPLCHEIAVALVRVERERVMEQRAKDRRSELERLADLQRGLVAKVKELR